MHCITLMTSSKEEIINKTDLLSSLEYDNHEIDNIVLSIDSKSFEDSINLKQAVLRKAYNISKLIQHYPDLYPYPESAIFSAIVNDYRKKAVSRYTMNMIYEAFSLPEYDKYKSHVYNSAKRRDQPGNNLEEIALGEKQIIDSQVFNALHFIKSNIDHPQIQSFMSSHAKEQVKQETKQRKEREDEDKVTMPRPDWIPEDVEGQDSHLYRACLKMAETWKDIAIRVFRYPPKTEEDDKFYSDGVETMNAILVPGTDLKYVRDTLSYLDITYEKMTQSIHSAMSKSKIMTPSKKWRKVTREQIADITPQMLLLAINIIEMFPGYIKLCLYWLRDQKPYSGEFHLERHDKLSESAFGKSSFMD